MYEMLVGYPPFCSDDPRITCRKVLLIVFSVSLIAKEVLVWHCSWNTCRALHSVFIHANNLTLILEHQIVNWRTCLKFPEEPKLSDDARDLICRLLCDVENRLGTRGVDEIKVVFR